MRKNLYTFTDLKQLQLPADLNESEAFFAMHSLCGDGQPIASFYSADEIPKVLLSNRYYVAQDLLIYKGKKAIFRGPFAMAEKEDLIPFLLHAVATDDLRPMLIAPVFDNAPNQVIVITEDLCYLYSKSESDVPS
jgi:hypothetical protein